MGKIIGIIAVIVVIVVVGAVLLFGKGGGIGGGAGEGEGDGNTKIETNIDTSGDEENDTVTVEEKKEEEVKEETEEQNNGATDTVEGAILNISVVENEYFYDNERITLDDFMIIVDGIESELVVEVKDDNASLRAYEDLIEKLEEGKIKYVEK